MCTSAGTCKCALLWIGPQCENPRPFKGAHLRVPHLAFDGSVVMSKASTKHLKNIEVTLPGKEEGGIDVQIELGRPMALKGGMVSNC